VRHQRVERLIASLLGEKPHPYSPHTVSVHLGYLMPEPRYRPWRFGDEPVAGRVGQMVDAINEHGLPFMGRLRTLDALVTAIQEGLGVLEQLAFRLPVVHLLLGEERQAVEVVRSSVGKLGERNDLAAQRLRSFAADLERHVRTGPSCRVQPGAHPAQPRWRPPVSAGGADDDQG